MRGDLSRVVAHIAAAVPFALGTLGCASRPPLITSLPPLEEQEAAAARQAAAEGPTENPLARLTFSEGKPLSGPIVLDDALEAVALRTVDALLAQPARAVSAESPSSAR